MAQGVMTGQTVDMDAIARLIVEVADEFIVPRHQQLQTGDIHSKTRPTDLVTIADIEAEKALDERLVALYPQSTVLGEESISRGEKSTAVLDAGTGMFWIVDPVDGTYNFVHGGPHFALMLACVIEGVTRYSWIYDIPGRRMMMAERGAGAFIDGQRMRLSAARGLPDSRGFVGLRYFPKEVRPGLMDFEKKIAGMGTYGCSAHEYLGLLREERDFMISPRARIWDHLPGMLAFEEAGGYACKWDGTPYTPADDLSGLMVASTQDLLEQLRAGAVYPLLAAYKSRL